MSADNGIYILQSPVFDENGNKIDTEFRVSHCQAIENIYYDIGFEFRYFNNSPIFNSLSDALMEAAKMFKEHHYIEYGIKILDEMDHPFPERA
jgi:hypothetical protein